MAVEGSLSLDRDGSIIRFSRSLEHILGYSDEEVLDKDISFLFSPSHLSETLSLIDEARGDEGVSTRKTCLMCKNGSTVDVYLSVYPLRDHGGELYSFIATISKDKKEDRPAILSKEFKRIFEFSNDAVAITDAEGNIIDVNEAFLRTYGYERGEVLGKNPRILKSRHSTPEIYTRMWRDILDPVKGFWKGEIINVRKDGTEVPVLLAINAIKDRDGEIKNFLGIAFDMTRLKEADKLNKMYIDYIIHDIRGPLTSIMANCELLGMMLEGIISAREQARIKTILESAEKIHTMTSDMLDYSKSRSGGLILRKINVDLGRMLKESVRPFESVKKNLVINSVPLADCVFEERNICVDADIVQRIIYNLLSNAFKYADTEVALTFECDTEGLTVLVSDDGKGISDEEAERIFDAFYQTSEEVKTGGAGLGLNIVKSFVETHGGRVWVEPGTPSGARFGIYIPIGE